jgi:hypothetical protein
MPFYIRVTSLITPVHCITQTEEPDSLSLDHIYRAKKKECELTHSQHIETAKVWQ